MKYFFKYICLSLYILAIQSSIVLAETNDEEFRSLLINDNIDRAIELQIDTNNSEWSFWIAQKYLSLNDIDSALKWYEQSKNEGNTNAHYQLAELLLHYKIDVVKSYQLFYELINSENKFLSSSSKYYLSIFYKHGIGVTMDKDRAFKYIKEASNEELTIAKYMIVDYLINGIGTKIDERAAAKLMFQFADMGYTEAEYDYAMMILNEIGLKRNEETAIAWLEKSAQKAYPPALQQLSSMYFYGIGVQKDDVKAYEYYLLAKQLGISDVELDMNMTVVSPDKKEIAIQNYANFRPRPNDYSITYLRIPQFMK
ncbi:MAG: sel1 repeat family protein [Alphaproteobacteria bacterium]|nr:sel1 repeat family protein [Alphaproteobacteria bacterium]